MLPPIPWDFEVRGEYGYVYLIDSNKRKIASLLGTKKEKLAMAKFFKKITEAIHDSCRDSL